MKPAPFKYIAPTSLEEALDALQNHGYDGKLLAGGQSLIPVMNFRLAQPAVIIDLNGVKELGTLNFDVKGDVRVGAMVRHSHLEHSERIAQMTPLISEVMPYIAHPQIRNRGTIGGSLAHADPAAELPVIMVTLDAQFRLQRRGGERWINAVDFYESLFMTALEPEEILVEIAISPHSPNSGYAFTELSRRHGDYAQVGVAAVVIMDESGICRDARLVYLSVGEVPMVAVKAAKMMVGERPTSVLIADAAEYASRREIDPMGDIHATADYKRHLAAVLGKRTLQQAVSRAKKSIQS
jgi:CO/xanthine dehydrogenase FAD-binding subunit